MKQHKKSRLLTFSLHVYRGLLFLLPKDLRDDHGHDMSQVFRDCCRDTHRQKGSFGVLGELFSGIFDLLNSAVIEGFSALMNDGRRVVVLLMITLVAICGGAYAAVADLRGEQWPGPVYMVVIFTFTLAFLRPSSSWLTGLLIGSMLPIIHFVVRSKGLDISSAADNLTLLGVIVDLLPALSGSLVGAASRMVLHRALFRS